MLFPIHWIQGQRPGTLLVITIYFLHVYKVSTFVNQPPHREAGKTKKKNHIYIFDTSSYVDQYLLYGRYS